MPFFVLTYDRRAGRLLGEQPYANSAAALQARFAAERENAARSEVEVVVLSAESADELRRTHARYFRTLDELVRDAVRPSLAAIPTA